MLAHLRTNRPKRIAVALLLIGSLLLISALLMVRAVADPLVDYYGTTLRQSELTAQTNHALYCQQLASFSLGANFTCFDSKQELDYFAANRPG